MIYHSTRSLENGVNAREALLKGLCDDGGLYVSDELLTCVLTPDMLKGLTYRETALRVFSVLLSDFTKTELAEGIERAREAIDSGAARAKVDAFVAATRRFASEAGR